MTDAESVLSVESETVDANVVITVAGDLDPHTAPLLEKELHQALEAGQGNVVVDMSGLGFMDSAGLRLLIGAHGQLRAADRRLVIRAPSEAARRLLRITGLDERIEVEQ